MEFLVAEDRTPNLTLDLESSSQQREDNIPDPRATCKQKTESWCGKKRIIVCGTHVSKIKTGRLSRASGHPDKIWKNRYTVPTFIPDQKRHRNMRKGKYFIDCIT